MKVKTNAALLASASALFGCAIQQPQTQAVYVPTGVENRPSAELYTQRQNLDSRLTWDAGGILGPCVATQTVTAPLPPSAAREVSNFFGMSERTSADFGKQRTGGMIVCGYNASRAQAVPLPFGYNPDVAQAPVYTDITTHDTGVYFVADKFMQCRGHVVLVRPSTKVSGQTKAPAMVTGPLKQFNNYTPDAGWAAPAGIVRDHNGFPMASSLICTQAMVMQTPVLRLQQN